MTRLLYVDTGAFVGLLWSRDAAHERLRRHLRILRAGGDRLVTSEAVVAETVTRLRYDAGLTRVQAFRDLLFEAGSRGTWWCATRTRMSGERRSQSGASTPCSDSTTASG